MYFFRNWEIPTVAILALAISGVSGCASASTSNTARTSVEQLLLANAVDQSLDKCNFSSFSNQNVFLQEKYVDCVDKNYIIASTRHRLFSAGARLVDSPEKADVVVELRAGAVGTTSANSFIGTPQLTLPGMVSIPEVKFAERRKQQAVAKLGLVAYDPKSNEVLGSGGTSLASANDNNWFMLGVGPYQNGSVKREVNRSTTGAAAQAQGELPVTVAFATPLTSSSQPPTQMAAEPAAEKPISPASHAELPAQPEWMKKK